MSDSGKATARLVELAEELARTRFQDRADEYEQASRFPAEDFADLIAAGLHVAAVPVAHGGHGLQVRTGLFDLWRITRALARANMSLARCWEGLVNSQYLIAGLGTSDQQRRWFDGMLREGHLWAAWSGEPLSAVPGQGGGDAVGTVVQEVDGGYRLDGCKLFATSAGHARWALLLVNLHGPGGARHAGDDGRGVVLLACDLTDPSVQIDDRWWDPLGMRATASHRVRFDGTFVPRENQLGEPGRYFADQWQTVFTPHYAATYLGGAEAAADYALEYLRVQEKTADPYVQQRVGRVMVNLRTCDLWLRQVAALWQAGQDAAARRAGLEARWLVEQLALDVLDHCIRACGARSLNRPSPVERIYRDLTFYVRHDNADHLLAVIGSDALGQAADLSFFHRGGGAPTIDDGKVAPDE